MSKEYYILSFDAWSVRSDFVKEEAKRINKQLLENERVIEINEHFNISKICIDVDGKIVLKYSTKIPEKIVEGIKDRLYYDLNNVDSNILVVPNQFKLMSI